MTTDLLLIRHAQTDLAGTLCGHLDPPLNPLGREQGSNLVRSLATTSIDAVYSSDLKRALTTGMALAASKGLPCRPSAMLREIGFGAWEGLDWAAVETRDPETAALWINQFPHRAAPDGEAFNDFKQRVLAKIADICSHPETSVAILTHAGVLRILLQHLLSLPAEQTWERPLPFCSCLHLKRARTSDRWSLHS